MKHIPLTQGKQAIVDDDDYDFLMQWKWHAHKFGHLYYAERTETSTEKRKTIRMHRLLLNAPKELVVDHKDHDGLNNTRNNIRMCTITQNNTNRRSEKHSASKYLGVCWFNRKQRWFASIRFNKKLIHLGSFINEKDAALAYNKRAAELHGEFANINKL